MRKPLFGFATAAVTYLAMSSVGAVFAQAVAPTDLSTPAPTIAITGGKLLTITHGVIENGTIILSGGKIAAVGAAGAVKIPTGAQIVDAKGMTVYPGLIDSETNLGLSEIEADEASNDLVETSDEIFPNMHVYDAFHAETEHIPITRINGITNAIVAPASDDTLPGQDIFIQLAGRDRDQMILGKDVALAMNFSGEQRRRGKDRKFPSTRMGLFCSCARPLSTRRHMRLAGTNIRPSSKSGSRATRKTPHQPRPRST